MAAEVYRSREIRALEAALIAGGSGYDLMRHAGRAAFRRVIGRYRRARKLTVICGVGNNGGDGYVVGECALRAGLEVQVLAAGAPRSIDAIAARRDFCAAGGAVIAVCDAAIVPDLHADICVDALFGIGLSRAPDGIAAALIARMNAASCPVVALDAPSGLNADNGVAFSPCIRADATVTFIGLKLGLLTGQGAEFAGEVWLEELGAAAVRGEVAPAARIIDAPRLPRRPRAMHKGDAGRVLVVGGAAGMLGAAVLAGEAALRAGSGLVTLAVPAASLDRAVQVRPELMSADALAVSDGQIARADAIVLGPGLGQGDWSQKVFAKFIAADRPMVLDADALNLLAADPKPKLHNRILTPHPGEAARLLHCTVGEVQTDRVAAANDIAEKYNGVCILKGAGTLVAAGGEIFLCTRGNPGMATAGMGDVLAGIIGALLGRGFSPADAACAGVYLHSQTADIAVCTTGEEGLLAGDIPAAFPDMP